MQTIPTLQLCHEFLHACQRAAAIVIRIRCSRACLFGCILFCLAGVAAMRKPATAVTWPHHGLRKATACLDCGCRLSLLLAVVCPAVLAVAALSQRLAEGLQDEGGASMALGVERTLPVSFHSSDCAALQVLLTSSAAVSLCLSRSVVLEFHGGSGSRVPAAAAGAAAGLRPLRLCTGFFLPALSLRGKGMLHAWACILGQGPLRCRRLSGVGRT